MGTSAHVNCTRIFYLHLNAVIRNEIIKLPLINQSRQVIYVNTSLQCGIESRGYEIQGPEPLVRSGLIKL